MEINLNQCASTCSEMSGGPPKADQDRGPDRRQKRFLLWSVPGICNWSKGSHGIARVAMTAVSCPRYTSAFYSFCSWSGLSPARKWGSSSALGVETIPPQQTATGSTSLYCLITSGHAHLRWWVVAGPFGIKRSYLTLCKLQIHPFNLRWTSYVQF